MMTGRIGHEVLLLINHNYNKIGDILGFLKIKTREILSFFFAGSEKKPFYCACAMARTAQLVRHNAYCPITLSFLVLKIRTVKSQSDLIILL